MQEILEVAKMHKDVWLGPFLRILNDKIPYLDNRGRKKLIDQLAKRGALHLKVREGYEHSYTVIVVNWNDPWVQKLHPECVPHFNNNTANGV